MLALTAIVDAVRPSRGCGSPSAFEPGAPAQRYEVCRLAVLLRPRSSPPHHATPLLFWTLLDVMTAPCSLP